MIRPASEQDAPWIAALWNRVIADTLVTFTTEPKSHADACDMIARRPVFVLPDGGGFAAYGPFRSGPGYAATVEHTILLAPQAQGHGQGRMLMRALMEHAEQADHHVMVAAISGANPKAVAFHSAIGFETVAHMPQVGRKAGTWLDLILMQKLL